MSLRMHVLAAVVGFASLTLIHAYSNQPHKNVNKSTCIFGLKSHYQTASVGAEESLDSNGHTRRNFLAASAAVASAITLSDQTANAFDNRLDNKYADVTPQIGTQPTDLGYMERASRTKGSYTGLKQCANSPNCWSSSPPFADNPSRYIPAWGGKSIKDVKQVIDNYEVGQNGVDGGGFKIMQYDEKEQYIYVQFQSYKAGYIDDFECWFNPLSQKFDVRSSSRLGMSDLGVNAKRLEYIGGRLEKEFGWILERRKNGSLV
jgi:uncharacterized protein (DUF1499 family)